MIEEAIHPKGEIGHAKYDVNKHLIMKHYLELFAHIPFSLVTYEGTCYTLTDTDLYLTKNIGLNLDNFFSIARCTKLTVVNFHSCAIPIKPVGEIVASS